MESSGRSGATARGLKDASPGLRFLLAALVLFMNIYASELGMPLVERLVLLVTFTLMAIGGIGAALHRRQRERPSAHRLHREDADRAESALTS